MGEVSSLGGCIVGRVETTRGFDRWVECVDDQAFISDFDTPIGIDERRMTATPARW